jgi:hypothetical protein
MKLTIRNRLKLCWEILTIRSGHAHTAQEKILSTFERGYEAGRLDEKLEQESECLGI